MDFHWIYISWWQQKKQSNTRPTSISTGGALYKKSKYFLISKFLIHYSVLVVKIYDSVTILYKSKNVKSTDNVSSCLHKTYHVLDICEENIKSKTGKDK
jgi:hypothetical protein